jgi:2-keto-4-pentenoate hydratase/2-oxohepta-3-ene-1,7-dioic acid hydratase in catechol pathway
MRWGRLQEKDGVVSFARIEGERAFVLDAPPWAGGADTGRVLHLAAARLLCPVTPSKIVAVGLNHRTHARELGRPIPAVPVLFLKPPSALLGPGGTIRLPSASQQVEHEAELGVVIGRRARNVPVGEALSCVLGYTCLGDISARDLQRQDVQCTRAKGFDTFCPVGPTIAAGLDPEALNVRCRVNGHLRQDGHTSDHVFSVAALLAFASEVMTLEPGDVLAAGTPAGVGPLVAGDRLEIEVTGVGVLCLDVAAEPG